jgi:hypothetical protein
MKSGVSLKRAAFVVGAIAPMTALFLVVSVRGTGCSERMHGYSVLRARRVNGPIANCGSKVGKDRQRRDNPLIHELMTSAISIAGRI